MKEQVLVVGGAKSGISVAILLAKHDYDVIMTDMKEMLSEDKKILEQNHIQVFDGGHPEHLKHNEYAFIVKNPGIPYHVPFIQYFVQQQVKIYTEIEVASWYCPHYQIAAITGTNGKTTATTLLHQMLNYQQKALLAGNIGIPFSQVVLEEGDGNYNVAMELSNFQLLGCEKFNPHISTVMNLSPDHLDYMDNDVEAYYQSKMKIYANNTEDDIFLLNIDDENIVRLAQNIPSTTYTYSLHQPADIQVRDGAIYFKDLKLVPLSSIKVVGKHNIQNVMIAATMAYLMGVEVDVIDQVVREFKGVEHRLEYVCDIDDIKYYNDSKSTNPDALKTALDAFDQSVILLAGGSDKGSDFTFLNQYDHKIKKLIAFGATKDQIMHDYSNTIECQNLDEALLQAQQLASSGDIILLSPGCASYDQFSNYIERGNYFKKQLLKGDK